ncbi:MAG: zinc-binding alcohol dehydrogenase, partial [Cyanobacteria bacterium J06626_14]
MKSLLLTSPYRLQWVEEPKRDLMPCEVLVETIASSISIGSELPQYEGQARLGYSVTYPKMTGYENVGYVIQIGSAVTALEVGQRVIAFYGYRTQAIVPQDSVVPIGDDISDQQAILTILSCDVAKGIRKLRPLPEERVLITGCGAIGLLAVFVLSAYGVRHVDVVEPLKNRRELALDLGAKAAISLEAANALESRYDAGLECSGYQSGFEVLQTQAKPNTRIAVISDGNREPLVLTPDFH